MKIGIDIGAATMKLGARLSDCPSWAGSKLADYAIVTDIPTADDFRKAGETIAGKLKEAFGEPECVAIGCFGPLNPKAKKILHAPNKPTWIGADFHLWEELLDCQIVLDNDANVAIYGEAIRGAGKGKNPVSGFTLGSGIGYGCTVDGKIYHGAWDVEGGHIILDPNGPPCGCGQKGCLEAYVASGVISKRFGKEPDELEDEDAWDFIAEKIAWGIQIVTAVVKPETFVLCGGMAQRKGLLIERVREHYRKMIKIYPKEAQETEILLGKFIPHSGIIGAVELAHCAI